MRPLCDTLSCVMLMICQVGGVLAACDGISRRRLLFAARDARTYAANYAQITRDETSYARSLWTSGCAWPSYRLPHGRLRVARMHHDISVHSNRDGDCRSLM